MTRKRTLLPRRSPAAWRRCARGVVRLEYHLHDNGDEVVIIRCANGSTHRVNVTGLELQESVETILEELSREVA